MYAVQHHRAGSRVAGASIAALTTGLAAWALVSVGAQKILAPVQKVMTVMLLRSETPPPAKPIPAPPREIETDLPAPKLVVPDIPVVVDTPIVAEPDPADIVTPPAPPTPDTTPRLAADSKPVYPPASIRAQEEGLTRLSLCVSERGRVTDATLIRSSGYSRLDAAALKWVRIARFKPATRSGQPVAMCNYDIIYQWDLRDAR